MLLDLFRNSLHFFKRQELRKTEVSLVSREVNNYNIYIFYICLSNFLSAQLSQWDL